MIYNDIPYQKVEKITDEDFANLYKNWKYLSLHNYDTIIKIKVETNRMISVIRNYLVEHKEFEDKKAQERARKFIYYFNKLFARYSKSSECESGKSNSLRTLILSDASNDEVLDYLNEDKFKNDENNYSYKACSDHALISPLISVSIRRGAEFLTTLRNKYEGLSKDDIENFDFDFNINAENQFGKTPLMEALQDNQIEAVSWLIENGADLDKNIDGSKIKYSYIPGKETYFDNDYRTPLM